MGLANQQESGICLNSHDVDSTNNQKESSLSLNGYYWEWDLRIFWIHCSRSCKNKTEHNSFG